MSQCWYIVRLLAALVVMAPTTASATSQVPCATVMSELNRVRKSEEKLILAMEKVAKKLDTTPLWVENCMRVYGRSVPREVIIDQDRREQLLERLEEVELGPEDLAPEDLAAPDPISDPEPESAGTKKRKPDEYIQRHRYLPLLDPLETDQ